MRLLFACLLALAALVFVREARADDEPQQPGTPTVDLYTIGPSNDFPSRFGHVLLCVRPSGHDLTEAGQCYDYGVPASEDMIEIGYTAMRGTPSFVPIMIDEPHVLAFFKDQGRAIERQRIPLSAEETKTLIDGIDVEVKEQRAYAYHPYWSNCTTKIRDHLDAATNGRLRQGPSTIPPGTLREYFEEGNTGHIGILTAMAIYLGEGNDHVPTPWEAMLLPVVLRDGVAERFHAPPEQLAERMAVILPTSRAIGRIAIFAGAFLLFVAVRVCARKNRFRLALFLVGGTFGALALSLDFVSLVVKWTEISHNWALLLFLPTDLALPWLAKNRLSLYLKARIAVAIVLGVLEIANVAHQPLLPLVALVILPCVGLLGVLKERVVATESANATAAV